MSPFAKTQSVSARGREILELFEEANSTYFWKRRFRSIKVWRFNSPPLFDVLEWRRTILRQRRCRSCGQRISRGDGGRGPMFKYCSALCEHYANYTSDKKKTNRAAWAKAKRDERRELGLCQLCGRPASGSARCEVCKARRKVAALSAGAAS